MTTEEIEALQVLQDLLDACRALSKQYTLLVNMNLTEVTALWKECPTVEELQKRLEQLCTSP